MRLAVKDDSLTSKLLCVFMSQCCILDLYLILFISGFFGWCNTGGGGGGEGRGSVFHLNPVTHLSLKSED